MQQHIVDTYLEKYHNPTICRNLKSMKTLENWIWNFVVFVKHHFLQKSQPCSITRAKKHKNMAENWSPYNPQKPIDTKDELRCDVCNVIVSSSETMETHLAGKKHHLKLSTYLDRVNAGAIAPPMSSRGFCDFNNVERWEANPLDPSKFVQEMILPKNLMGSFVNREESHEPSIPYDMNMYDSGFSRPGGYVSEYSEYKSEYDVMVPNYGMGGAHGMSGSGGRKGGHGMGGGYDMIMPHRGYGVPEDPSTPFRESSRLVALDDSCSHLERDASLHES